MAATVWEHPSAAKAGQFPECSVTHFTDQTEKQLLARHLMISDCPARLPSQWKTMKVR
uniref:Uncharacterized protein n=1 Tax=Anguilla anguilla TaxID=7936 RepID=A0A0E9QI07_ANGAN